MSEGRINMQTQTQMNAPTNTTGIIGAAAANQEIASKRKSPATLMREIVNAQSTQDLLKNSLGANAGAYTASIIDLYNSDTYLQKCDPGQVMRECLKAVSLKLPISKQLGFAYVIPYKKDGMDIPQFQLGYKGMIQLCQRTGAYKYINAGPVYEGEYVKEDKLSGALDLSGTRTGNGVVGYFAYIETLNGFSKCIYWPVSRMVDHAKKYSKSYTRDSSPWKTNFEEMAQKTMLRALLGHWGVMSVEMETAFNSENAEAADAQIVSDQSAIPVDGEIDADRAE
jgi:recombination protein RecT